MKKKILIFFRLLYFNSFSSEHVTRDVYRDNTRSKKFVFYNFFYSTRNSFFFIVHNVPLNIKSSNMYRGIYIYSIYLLHGTTVSGTVFIAKWWVSGGNLCRRRANDSHLALRARNGCRIKQRWRSAGRTERAKDGRKELKRTHTAGHQ